MPIQDNSTSVSTYSVFEGIHRLCELWWQCVGQLCNSFCLCPCLRDHRVDCRFNAACRCNTSADGRGITSPSWCCNFCRTKQLLLAIRVVRPNIALFTLTASEFLLQLALQHGTRTMHMLSQQRWFANFGRPPTTTYQYHSSLQQRLSKTMIRAITNKGDLYTNDCHYQQLWPSSLKLLNLA